MTIRLLILSIVFLASACESKPAVDPNAPKTPAWEACIKSINTYADCKVDEVGQVDEGLKGRTEAQLKIKRNQAVVSEEKCTSVLAGLPSDDACVPK